MTSARLDICWKRRILVTNGNGRKRGWPRKACVVPASSWQPFPGTHENTQCRKPRTHKHTLSQTRNISISDRNNACPLVRDKWLFTRTSKQSLSSYPSDKWKVTTRLYLSLCNAVIKRQNLRNSCPGSVRAVIVTKLLLTSAFEVDTIVATTDDSLNKHCQDRGCLKILCNYDSPSTRSLTEPGTALWCVLGIRQLKEQHYCKETIIIKEIIDSDGIF